MHYGQDYHKVYKPTYQQFTTSEMSEIIASTRFMNDTSGNKCNFQTEHSNHNNDILYEISHSAIIELL